MYNMAQASHSLPAAAAAASLPLPSGWRKNGPVRELFLATCPVTDREMELRILRHVQDRRKGNWDTVEEPVDLAGRLRKSGRYDTVLIDCLTLWVNNLMYEAEQANRDLDEDGCRRKPETAAAAAGNIPAK